MGTRPQGWADAVFQVMEKQVFSSFLSENTCLGLGMCSQTQEMAGLLQDRAPGSPSGSRACRESPGPAAGFSATLGLGGLGSRSEQRHRENHAPGAQSLVSERPKRGHPGDGTRARVTQSRARAQRVGLGFVHS